ncbi:hypothetical protein Tco_0545114 [Tanacetum coccineum]
MIENRISPDPDRTWVDGIRCATQIMKEDLMIVDILKSCSRVIILSDTKAKLPSLILGQMTYSVASSDCDITRILCWACAFHQDKASSVKVPVANEFLWVQCSIGIFRSSPWQLPCAGGVEGRGRFRAEEMPFIFSCRMASKVMTGVSDVDVLLGGILSTKDDTGYDKDGNNECNDNVVEEEDREWIRFLGGNSSSGIEKYRGLNSSDGGNIGDRVKIAGGVIGFDDEIVFEELRMASAEAGNNPMRQCLVKNILIEKSISI